ncbi:Chaperone protein dnaJ 15 [Acorus calamus]|uniref:Chaperone protein dnaJ 15 n=1 Tax=Acorus calamus TaxID=4465 RepID=A0AAV9EYB1_ACOCL|nr:Chaperone protein dnaJ 15 [Acorus calamus]
MAASEENSALFPIFILTIMALPLVPYTIVKLCRAFSEKTKPVHCGCTKCSRSGKYRRSIFKRISNFSTYSNLTIVLLWIVMVFLVYYIKQISRESQPFEPFGILGLEPGASESEIKKAYRRLSILYHPDKNPDPEAHNYFVEFISKAYQALTDPISRENFEKYGHLMADSKVMDVFIKAAEYMEIPVRRSDNEPLQKLFMVVRSELNLDLKNIKQEQAKFWKQHPCLVKTELLIQAQLTRESATLPPVLQSDFKHVLELAPRLLEELMKMTAYLSTQFWQSNMYCALLERTPLASTDFDNSQILLGDRNDIYRSSESSWTWVA